MNLNQVVANLDIVSSSIHRLNVSSQMFKISDSNQKEFGLDIKCSKPTIIDGVKFGKLLMQIQVSVLPEQIEFSPDFFELVIEGVFSANTELPDEEFMTLLNINGGAALYSIARSKIETISSLTYAEGKILLPMINIVQYYQEQSAEG